MPLRPARKPPTRVFITRHGQTVSNREGRFCGHSETSLTELGREQARALGRRLEGTTIDAVYTSDFSRAIETASLVVAGRGLTPRVDPALRELHYGEWEMERAGDVLRRWPEQYKLMRAEDPAWHPPGGENVAMVRERTSAAFARIVKAHRHQAVLVVMHGTAINCLVSSVLGMDIAHTFRFEVSNCGLTEIVLRRSTPIVVRLNDASHLAGMGAKPAPAARR
jgi:broad specificity phosphatase PhoE